MKDVRCSCCNKKLARANGQFELEIKCPRCGTVTAKVIEPLNVNAMSVHAGGQHDRINKVPDRC